MNDLRFTHFLPFALAMLIGCGDSNAVEEACKNNDDCAEGEFCASGLCPGDFSSGECIERPDPTECANEADATVCGCDNLTYRNPCFASAEGVRLAIEKGCPCEDASDCTDEQSCVDNPSDNDVARCEFR